jgi:LemA protein
MGKLGCVVAIVIGLLVLGLIVMKDYNKLVGLREDVNKKWADVESQYQRRADLVPNLVATVQGAASFEKETFQAVAEARASVGRAQLPAQEAPDDPAALARYEQAQAQLGSALQRLLVVVERYPELKANANFRDLQAQLEGTENRISVERMRYNERAQEYNTARLRFPATIFARLLGFGEKAYFRAQAGAEQAPPVQFNFGSPTPGAAPATPRP